VVGSFERDIEQSGVTEATRFPSRCVVAAHCRLVPLTDAAPFPLQVS
jgi:hypothetical protein